MRETTVSLVVATVALVSAVLWVIFAPTDTESRDIERIRHAQNEIRHALHHKGGKFPPIDKEREAYSVTPAAGGSFDISGYVDTFNENFEPLRLHWIVNIEYRDNGPHAFVVALE